MRRVPVLAVVAVGLVLAGAGCDASTRATTPGSGAASSPARASTGASAGGSATGAAGPTAPPAAVDPSGAAGASPSGSPWDPALLLRTGAARLEGANLRFTLGSGVGRVDGVYEAATGAASLARVVDGRRVAVDTVGDEILLSGFVPDGSVLRVNPARLPAGSELLPAAAPLFTLRLLAAVRRAEPSGNGYSGRLDLTRVDPGSSLAAQRLIAFLLKQAGDRAGEIAFTATIDVSGRLSGFRTTFPRADAGRDLEYEFTVVEVGTPVAVPRPTGPVVEAPASMYAA